MRKKILLLMLLIGTFNGHAQLHEWSQSIDGLKNQIGMDIKMDAIGNTFIAGRVFDLTISLSPSPGVYFVEIITNNFTQINQLIIE